jgi:regulator of ribonuclease activity A
MKLKTSDICDQFADQVQVVEPLFHDFGGAKSFHGPIVTLKVLHDYVPLRKILETPGQGRVLVVDGGGSVKRALLGDKLATLGLEKGWAGVVIWGAVRDIEELAQIPFGVKALATCPMRGEKSSTDQADILLRFAGVAFAPGHYLYADADGIVVAPKALHQ